MKKRIGERLVEAGLIDRTQLTVALGDQRRWGGKLGSTLIRRGFVTDMDLVPVLGRHLGVRYARLEGRKIPREILSRLQPGIARKYNVLPIGLRGRTLLVATADPTDLRALDAVQFAANMNIQPVLAIEDEIRAAIDLHYGEGRKGVDPLPERIPLAASGRRRARPAGTAEAAVAGPCGGTCRETVEALVRLLQAKGIISEAELRDIILSARSFSERAAGMRPQN